MVKGLEGMIRLHKWQLDEKRRQLNDLEAMRDDLLRQKALLAEQLSFEQQKAAAAPVVDFAYANYATSVMQRQQNLQNSLNEIEASIEDMKEQVAEAFKEMKKYEIVERREQERRRAQAHRRQQADLDELAVQMHRRKNRASA